MKRASPEKPVTIPAAGPATEDRVLEGIYLPGERDGGVLVAPPHPMFGGSMDNPVVCEVAYACQRAGLASLRFNWRGVGASTGAPSGDPRDARADYAAALSHLAESVSGPLTACGYSFGAAAAVRTAPADPRVRRLVLIAPPPDLLDRAALKAFGGELRIAVGGRDSIAPAAAVEELAAGLERVEVAEIPEADHFFAAGLARVGRTVFDWLYVEAG